MKFLDRENERKTLLSALNDPDGAFCCVFGRRRCGKSRLLIELTTGLPAAVYFVADQSEATLQRARLAADIARVIPDFDRVVYPDWGTLFDSWCRSAPKGGTLVIDELPYLVEQSSELPSVLQRVVDRLGTRSLHIVVCGSSQRMMQGLVIDAAAPLYGRARAVLKIRPLDFKWTAEAFDERSSYGLLARYGVWGGVPRYWELACRYRSHWDSVRDLVFDRNGVLRNEPERLLRDDLRDVVQAASILALIGQGCGRVSEIAARIGKPATALMRPLKRLIELDLVDREVPFGTDGKNGKKSVYTITDPFLAFWYKFVQPNRSLLDSVPLDSLRGRFEERYQQHLGGVFERLARGTLCTFSAGGTTEGLPLLKPAQRWWGTGLDKRPMELDVVSESLDGRTLFVGEVKMKLTAGGQARVSEELRHKAANLPFASRYERTICRVFTPDAGLENGFIRV